MALMESRGHPDFKAPLDCLEEMENQDVMALMESRGLQG